MKQVSNRIPVEQIEREALRGKEVIHKYFDPKSTRVRGPLKVERRIKKTNLDLTTEMLSELDQVAENLNVSRQAVIKVLLRQALDQHTLAQDIRKRSR